MMEYYCTGGVLQYASGHLTPIELLHVHRVREGERVAKASPSPVSHHAHAPALKREMVVHEEGENMSTEQDPTMELFMVSMDLTLLHCPLCLRPLKPLVYEV